MAAAAWVDLLQAPPAPVGLRPGPPPEVSVLVPAYDAAGTVGAALESALTQVPAPLEVIVSDDGSRDDLATALRPFAARVRLVRGVNGGLAVARNRAAAVARGQLLALLDADDVWLPGRVAALRAAAAARPDLAVLTTDAAVVRNGVVTEPSYYATRHFELDDQPTALLHDNFIFGAGAVRADAFRAVGGYSPAARYAEDWDLWLRLVLRGHRAGLVDAVLYEYRRRAGSLTDQRVDLALGVLRALERARPLLTAEQHEPLRRSQDRWRRKALAAAVRSRDPRAAQLLAGVACSRGVPVVRAAVQARLARPDRTARALLAPWRRRVATLRSRARELPWPVGQRAAERRLVAATLRRAQAVRVLVVGPLTGLRPALAGVHVDVAGTSPYDADVNVVSTADRPASLPAARWDAVVVTDPGDDPAARLEAALRAARRQGPVVLLRATTRPRLPPGCTVDVDGVGLVVGCPT